MRRAEEACAPANRVKNSDFSPTLSGFARKVKFFAEVFRTLARFFGLSSFFARSVTRFGCFSYGLDIEAPPLAAAARDVRTRACVCVREDGRAVFFAAWLASLVGSETFGGGLSHETFGGFVSHGRGVTDDTLVAVAWA